MNNWQLSAIGSRQNQQGFSLIMALGFMVFLTLIVLSMVNVTSSDEKIARNSRDKDLAFAAAEAALRDAEMYISGSYMYPYNPKLNVALYTSNCPNALCDLRSTPVNLGIRDFFSPDIYGSKSNVLGYASDGVTPTTYSPKINGVASQPRYLIEVVNTNDPSGNNPIAYRITAQSVGKSMDTRVTLQELYNP
ncbi:PilX N-terminal domain-containing pilus assembly protein [Sideroxydans sp. CL21]|uniref:pilus assembly PilX family protein n=1 Tax=Sideroxydans sp. CL21 TaxID=2600596 RepID=UPI0024BC970F|nr:PilX N-terminal domain-containing pilus assembly protein [Sideroxydans sp. CL21]